MNTSVHLYTPCHFPDGESALSTHWIGNWAVDLFCLFNIRYFNKIMNFIIYVGIPPYSQGLSSRGDID
jgi:hypothetical protein